MRATLQTRFLLRKSGTLESLHLKLLDLPAKQWKDEHFQLEIWKIV